MSPAVALTITSQPIAEQQRNAPTVVAIVEDQAAIAELLHDVLDDAGYLPVDHQFGRTPRRSKSTQSAPTSSCWTS